MKPLKPLSFTLLLAGALATPMRGSGAQAGDPAQRVVRPDA